MSDTLPLQENNNTSYLFAQPQVVVPLLLLSIALLTIGILASSGVFNFMGISQAHYLAYGMYGGFALVVTCLISRIAMTLAKNRLAQRRGEDEVSNTQTPREENKKSFWDFDFETDATKKLKQYFTINDQAPYIPQISKITVSAKCTESPCKQHRCTINIAQFSFEEDLTSVEIKTLMNEIDQTKFVYNNQNGAAHFAQIEGTNNGNDIMSRILKEYYCDHLR